MHKFWGRAGIAYPKDPKACLGESSSSDRQIYCTLERKGITWINDS
jgi:hypothetical protein